MQSYSAHPLPWSLVSNGFLCNQPNLYSLDLCAVIFLVQLVASVAPSTKESRVRMATKLSNGVDIIFNMWVPLGSFT